MPVLKWPNFSFVCLLYPPTKRQGPGPLLKEQSPNDAYPFYPAFFFYQACSALSSFVSLQSPRKAMASPNLHWRFWFEPWYSNSCRFTQPSSWHCASAFLTARTTPISPRPGRACLPACSSQDSPAFWLQRLPTLWFMASLHGALQATLARLAKYSHPLCPLSFYLKPWPSALRWPFCLRALPRPTSFRPSHGLLLFCFWLKSSRWLGTTHDRAYRRAGRP